MCFVGSNSEIILPKTLKNISSNSFQWYRGKHIEFFSNIEFIETNSFFECPYLEYIKFNNFNNVCNIRSEAFNNCPMLKLIIVPFATGSLLRFDQSSFISCPRLRHIRYNVDMLPFRHHFNKGFFSNSAQLSIISPSNTSCDFVSLSFGEQSCNIIHFCTSSYSSFFLTKSLFPLHPFISM